LKFTEKSTCHRERLRSRKSGDESKENRPFWPGRHAPDEVGAASEGQNGRITARSGGKEKRKKGTVPSTKVEVGLLAEVV
jgi:hypothetical protein